MGIKRVVSHPLRARDIPRQERRPRPTHLNTWSHRPSTASQSDKRPSLLKGEMIWAHGRCKGVSEIESPCKRDETISHFLSRTSM